MPAFIIATVHISDPARFAEYAKAIAGLAESHGGDYVVRGAVSEYLEGTGPQAERVVVSRFPDATAARAYIHSAAYQAALAARTGAAEVTMRLIEG